MALIAYTYEADTHCPSCALRRFGAGLVTACCDEDTAPVDSEGNPVRPLYEYDVHPLTDDRVGLSCGSCSEPIYEDEIAATWDRAYDRERTYHAYYEGDDALPGFDWDAVRQAWITEGRFGDGRPDELDPFIEAAVIAYGEDVLRLTREQERACYDADLLTLIAA